MQNVDDRQRMPDADLEIERVVRGRHFQNAGPEFRIDRGIAHDWQFLARERPPDMHPDEREVTRIVGMNRDRRIGHDRFWAGRRDFDEGRWRRAGQRKRCPCRSWFVDELVANIIELPLLRPRDDFLVGKRGLRRRIPIDHTPAAVDVTFAIKVDENVLNRADVIVVEGVTLARPIARSAEPLQLLDDDAAVFLGPFDHPPDEFFPAEILPRFVFRLPQILFDRGLRPDSRVIRPRQPENFESLHARAPGEDVLDRVVENVPERQNAGHVRRRNNDGIRRLRRMRVRAEISRFLPACVPFRFHGIGIVGFRQLSHREE